MIRVVLVLMVLIIYYQSYQLYDQLYEGNHILLDCPEKYEIGMGELSKLEKYPHYVGYSKNEHYYTLLLMQSDEPLPINPDFFK